MNPTNWYRPGPRWTFLDGVNWAVLAAHERRFAGWSTFLPVNLNALATYGPSSTPTPTEDSRS